MNASQTTSRHKSSSNSSLTALQCMIGSEDRTLGRTLTRGAIGIVLLTTLLLLGAAEPSAKQSERADLVLATEGWTFSITSWMASALLDKLETTFSHPAAGLPVDEETRLVRAFVARTAEMRAVQHEIDLLYSRDERGTPKSAALQTKLDSLREQQQQDQRSVEQVIQRQISAELAARGITLAGFTFPPVQFTFSEAPKKLVVSPRDRIETSYYRMLEPDFSTELAEKVESSIADENGYSAFVTRIGGMGAFPTMVVESPSLTWVFSTVAHEWVHNYLTLHPLGVSYNNDPALSIINETVAEIVGNEVGEAVVQTYYPDLAPPDATIVGAVPRQGDAPEIPPSGPMPFDFRTEMRRTRLIVDRLLGEGRVDDAEAYMEQRRRRFVDNGYPLRKLNQAYFAFYGSYGTSAASSDPIVPKLFALRAAKPDINSFLRSVRGITSADELDAVLVSAGVE